MGDVHLPVCVAMESTLHSSKKWQKLSQTSEIILVTPAKNPNQMVKEVCTSINTFFFNSINGEGVLLKGGQRSTFKMVQFTLNYSRNIIDKANRWMISGRNASNIWDICRRFCFEIIKIIASQEYKCPDQSLFSETNKWVVLISSGWVGKFRKRPLVYYLTESTLRIQIQGCS